MSGQNKRDTVIDQRKSRRFCFVISALIIMLFLLVWWLWQRQLPHTTVNQQNAVHNVHGGSDDTIANLSIDASDLKDKAITLDKIDPTVWKEVMQQNGMLTVGNFNENFPLDGLYIQPSGQPASGDRAGTFGTGLRINADSVALGADTTGDYVQSISVGNGLLQSDTSGEGAAVTLTIGAGNGIVVDAGSVGIRLQSGGGLTFAGNGLSLLDTCGDSQLLKWVAATSAWDCASDNAGSGSLTVRESDGSPSVNPVSVLEFGPSTGSSAEFIVTNESGGTSRVRAGSAIPLAGAAATISGSWTFNGEIAASGGLACASCVALGSETSGDYLAGLLAGSGINISGSGGESTTPTVSLDSSLALFKTIDASLGTDPVADSLTDTLSLTSGNGVTVTGDATADSVAFSLNLAGGSGLMISGGALMLLNTCANGQYLAWNSGSASWSCASLAGAPNVFQTVAGDSGASVTDSASDTVTLAGGNGLTSTASDATDTVTFDIDLASGSGLAFSSGALSLQSCADGQILKRTAGAWACGTDATGAAAYKQQLAGTDNVNIGAGLTPLLTNGSGVAQSLPITIASSNEVSFFATVEASSTLAAGPVTYTVIRDDNADNDCGTGGGDGTQVGGQLSSFIASAAQSFTTTLSFADTAPIATTGNYQLCASTSIATGTTTAADRSLKLDEVSL